MKQVFLPGSPYTKQARSLAILWTLLIFIGCLTPGRELPHVNVPFIDKWLHLVMFGAFSFLWLCARPALTLRWGLSLLIISTVFGCVIEGLQGLFTSLGRSAELMDAIADAVGAVLGIVVFLLGVLLSKK